MQSEIKAQLFELARKLRVEGDRKLARDIINLLRRSENEDAQCATRPNRLEPVPR